MNNSPFLPKKNNLKYKKSRHGNFLKKVLVFRDRDCKKVPIPHIGTKDRKNGNFGFLQLLALNFASSP